MTFRNAFGIACLVFASLTSTFPAAAAEQHNLILLVPEAMQSANVSDGTAPALARLRAEGVYFQNSYTGYPDLGGKPDSALNPEGLIASAVSVSYSTALVNDDGSRLAGVLNETLPHFKQANRPFLLVYRLGGLAKALYSQRHAAAVQRSKATVLSCVQAGGWINRAPASNADVARTIAELLNLEFEQAGQKGRVLTESLVDPRNRRTPQARKHVLHSTPSIEGLITQVRLQSLGSAMYLDAACDGRTDGERGTRRRPI